MCRGSSAIAALPTDITVSLTAIQLSTSVHLVQITEFNISTFLYIIHLILSFFPLSHTHTHTKSMHLIQLKIAITLPWFSISRSQSLFDLKFEVHSFNCTKHSLLSRKKFHYRCINSLNDWQLWSSVTDPSTMHHCWHFSSRHVRVMMTAAWPWGPPCQPLCSSAPPRWCFGYRHLGGRWRSSWRILATQPEACSNIYPRNTFPPRS